LISENTKPELSFRHTFHYYTVHVYKIILYNRQMHYDTTLYSLEHRVSHKRIMPLGNDPT